MSDLQNINYNPEESFSALFEKSLIKHDMRIGEVVTAEVIRVDHSFVIVNASLKSDAYIPIEEFINDQGNLEVKVGDFVSVAIDALENGYGDTILSRDKAKRLASWLSLEKALDNNELVTGTITGKVKGGMTVMVNSIRAFLPGSLIDTRPIKDTSSYEGKTIEFKVIKLDRKRNNVVLSRRAVIEASQGEERNRLLSTLKEGGVVNGIVKNITDYGAFIDLGGVDGLLHITDIAWRRIRHPSEALSLGQEISAKILKFDQEKNRVSLGMKQLGDDPWNGISLRYPTKTKLLGKVANITDYGAFVEIEPGIEGLVHISEMDWTNKNISPSKIIQLGNEVEVMVLEIDEERRRISLGIKQCKQNPWEVFNNTFKKGDKINGIIKSITDFGIFVGLPGGIDGLVHLSDLSWTESGEESVRKYKKGETVSAIIFSIDAEKERISLGIKQLEEDPFNKFISMYDKGSIITGTIKLVENKGANIKLNNNINGYIRNSEISQERVEDARIFLKEGNKISAMIISIDKKSRNVNLSIKAKNSAEQQQALRNLATDSNSAASGTTNLGTLLKAKLNIKN